MEIPRDIAAPAIALTDGYFDLQGLSAYASIPIGTLRDHIKRGMPCFKVGKRILVKRSEFDAWIETHRMTVDVSGIVDEIMTEWNAKSDTISEGHGR